MSYISGNGTFQPQAKKALIFFLKKVFLIFQEGICKTWKTNGTADLVCIPKFSNNEILSF